jgi:hypothetical protein
MIVFDCAWPLFPGGIGAGSSGSRLRTALGVAAAVDAAAEAGAAVADDLADGGGVLSSSPPESSVSFASSPDVGRAVAGGGSVSTGPGVALATGVAVGRPASPSTS